MSLEEFAEEMKKLRVQGKKQKEQEMMEQQKLEKQTDPDEETDEDILKKRMG
jgi:hypothetical protein